MKDQPPLPQPLRDTLSAEAQAAVSASAESFDRRIARWEERPSRNSSNSSRPPPSDPPSLRRRPPSAPSGKKRGGQPGHALTHLWTFVRVEGIETTNNHAQRALRPGVVDRKTSGGTDSEPGSRFVERALTVVATCRQQEIDVLDDLTRCYRAHLDGRAAPSLVPAEPPPRRPDGPTRCCSSRKGQHGAVNGDNHAKELSCSS